LPPGHRAINTESNLSVEVFQDIVATLGLSYRSEYALAEKVIIERLLALRNGLAHGQWVLIDVVEYEQLREHIDSLLKLFCDEVENAAALESFRRQGKRSLGSGN
jgi:hypothetical protein